MNNAEQVYAFVASKVSSLQSRSDTGKTAALARLRRAVGKAVGSVPEVWEYIYDGLPDEIEAEMKQRQHAASASPSEVAIQTALSLYAMHSQGNDGMNSKTAGSLGRAIGLLKYRNPTNEAGIKRRFDALATAKTPEELIYHARGIIQLLKQGEVMLDYPGFAKDLYFMQLGGDAAKRIQRKWGRDYYGNFSEDKSNESKARQL
ncbi:MAG: type I-E CRISPR-associated protein Cse2/CasB [Clostridiales Family XIII bacterium]|nr:type I-E CRISPR-associated protein Cse2/CasB [Clostridiales Family XIII bacterium]